MSIYTEQEKIKSLWHPITDDDFSIDWTQNVILCYVVKGIGVVTPEELPFIFDPEISELHDEDAETFAEKFKQMLRSDVYGYMYMDDDFFRAIEGHKFARVEDVTGTGEHPYLFFKTKTGYFSCCDSYDYEPDGTLSELVSLDDIEYIVNLDRIPATTPSVLFVDLPVKPDFSSGDERHRDFDQLVMDDMRIRHDLPFAGMAAEECPDEEKENE